MHGTDDIQDQGRRQSKKIILQQLPLPPSWLHHSMTDGSHLLHHPIVDRRWEQGSISLRIFSRSRVDWSRWHVTRSRSHSKRYHGCGVSGVEIYSVSPTRTDPPEVKPWVGGGGAPAPCIEGGWALPTRSAWHKEVTLRQAEGDWLCFQSGSPDT